MSGIYVRIQNIRPSSSHPNLPIAELAVWDTQNMRITRALRQFLSQRGTSYLIIPKIIQMGILEPAIVALMFLTGHKELFPFNTYSNRIDARCQYVDRETRTRDG